jgi:hypothetical protein
VKPDHGNVTGLSTYLSFPPRHVFAADNALGVSLTALAAFGPDKICARQDLTDRDLKARPAAHSCHSALAVTAGRGANAAPQRAAICIASHWC